MTIDNTELKHTISTNLPGHYPITSSWGYKYIFLMVKYDSNYIHIVPIKSCKAEALANEFNECYNVLQTNGFKVDIVWLDNEVSKLLIEYIITNKLTYQLASPGGHQTSHTRRAIQTYKNHFISALQSIVPQINITFNLLQNSRINPKLSAYSQIHGPFDFNKTPVALLECKIIIQNQVNERRSWAPRGTSDFLCWTRTTTLS